jgi:hypothetical protein
MQHDFRDGTLAHGGVHKAGLQRRSEAPLDERLEGFLNTLVDRIELIVGNAVRGQYVNHIAERAE